MNLQPVLVPTEAITDCAPITSSVTVSSMSESSSDGDSTNNNSGSDMLKTITAKEKLPDKNFKIPRRNNSTTTPLMGNKKTAQAVERKEPNLPPAQEEKDKDKDKEKMSKSISSDGKRKSKGIE